MNLKSIKTYQTEKKIKTKIKEENECIAGLGDNEAKVFSKPFNKTERSGNF